MNKTFPIELNEDLHKRLKIAAIHDGLTLHDWIVKTLDEKVCDSVLAETPAPYRAENPGGKTPKRTK